jgi:hypothetical protein
VAGRGTLDTCCEEGFSAVEGWDPAGGDLFCLCINKSVYKMTVKEGKEYVSVIHRYLYVKAFIFVYMMIYVHVYELMYIDVDVYVCIYVLIYIERIICSYPSTIVIYSNNS